MRRKDSVASRSAWVIIDGLFGKPQPPFSCLLVLCQFQTFADRVSQLDIDVIHRVDDAEIEPTVCLIATTHFQCGNQWRLTLNLSTPHTS